MKGKLIQKIKCYIGLHERTLLGLRQPFYQEIVSKCLCCGKYEVYHLGLNCNCWTDDITQFPEMIQKYIKENDI